MGGMVIGGIAMPGMDFAWSSAPYADETMAVAASKAAASFSGFMDVFPERRGRMRRSAAKLKIALDGKAA
ncbi:MAG TPA: hypothetical protein VLV55_00990, partial [Rhizomicrobium sp.]|nr:hypothetical protein [Rhizomicrobium sp.]